MYCQNCGSEVAQEANFCSSCGMKIENTAVAAGATATATTEATEAPSQAASSQAGVQEFAAQPVQPAGTGAEQPIVPQPNQQQYGGSGQQTYQQSYQQPYQQPAAQNCAETFYAHTQQTETLALVAFVFALISTITAGWLLIPLAWMIPMTVRTWGIYKGKKPNTTAFGVCSLLFLNLVGGILLLVADKDE